MIVRLQDVVNRVNTNIDRFNTDIKYYLGKGHGECGEIAITEHGSLKEDVGMLGFKFHFAFKPKDTLFFSRSFALKKAGMATYEGLCSDSTYILRTKDENVLLPEYLPIVVQSEEFWEFCNTHHTGGVNFLINWSTLAAYEFSLPPIETQRVLAEKLWAAYHLKEAYKKLLKATEDIVKAQFVEMFGGCDKYKISDFCTTVSGGTPNTKKKEYYEGGNIPWLSSGEINQGYVSSTDKHITQLGLENSSAKWVPANSVVIAMYGATAGKVGLIKIPLTTNQAVCTLLPNEDICPLFLYYAALSKTSWMISQCRGAAQPNISQNIIRDMEIPKASKELQQQFVSIAEQADKSMLELRKSIASIYAVIKSMINGAGEQPLQ